MTKEEILKEIGTLNATDRAWLCQRLKENISESDVCYNEAKRTWIRLYGDITGERYYWTGKDGKNLKQLLTKIRSKMRETQAAYNDIDLVANFEIFCRKGHNADTWVANHFTVAIVNCMFNELYTKIKNGQKSNGNRTSKHLADEYLAGIARDLQS